MVDARSIIIVFRVLLFWQELKTSILSVGKSGHSGFIQYVFPTQMRHQVFIKPEIFDIDVDLKMVEK